MFQSIITCVTEISASFFFLLVFVNSHVSVGFGDAEVQ